MYGFSKAICLSRSIGSTWTNIDISNMIVKDIFDNYTKVYLELSNVVLVHNVYVDLDTLKQEFYNYNNTLTQLLIDLGNRTLSTIPSLPNTSVKFAKYSDAFRSNYKVHITKIGVAVPDNYSISELTDLVLTRPSYNTDLSMIHDYCLTSVNGFYHRTDTDGVKAYVYDGAKSLAKSNNNQLGLISFLDIGKLTKVSIDKTKIVGQTDTALLKDGVYFSIEEDITNKSIMLVLGGYLIFPKENVFWQTGDKSFAVNINNIHYIERIYESDLYIDLSSLELTTHAINSTMINIDELWSDEVIKNYFTMSQSFLVIVDTPNLVTNKIYLKTSNSPGIFTAYRDPEYPLVVNYGKVAEYWKVYEDGIWSVTVQDSFVRNYILSEQPVASLANVTNQLNSNNPFNHSYGYLLEIAGYTI